MTKKFLSGKSPETLSETSVTVKSGSGHQSGGLLGAEAPSHNSMFWGGKGKKRDVREQSSRCEGWLWDSAEEVGGAGWVVEHSGPGSSWSMEAGVVVEPTVGERASS